MAKNLNPRQEHFARLLAAGSHSVADAYRLAYDKGEKATKSIYEAASRLSRNVGVQSRIVELRAPAVAASGMTFEGHLAELARLRDSAKAAGQHGPAVAAEVWRGKAAGYHAERVKTEDLDKLTEDELEMVQRGKVPDRLKIVR